MRTVFQLLAGGLFLLFAFVFVSIPSQSVEMWLGEWSLKLEKYYALILLILALSALSCYWLAEIVLAPGTKDIPPETASPKRKQLLFQSIISLFLLAVTLMALETPLDLDELQQGAKFLTRDVLTSINPAHSTEIHSLAHLSSLISMKIFGASKFSLRLPAVFFSVGFLLALNLFCLRYLKLGTSLLLFTHLAVNEFILWYLHSARGYVSSLFIGTLILFMVFDVTSGRLGMGKCRLPVWLFLLVVSIFCHPFTALFVGIIFISLLHWTFLNRKTLSFAQLSACRQLIGGALFVLPGLCILFAYVGMSLNSVGDFSAGGFPSWEAPLLALFGLARGWAGRLVFLLVAGVMSLGLVTKKIPRDFLSLFVIHSIVFFTVVLGALEVRHLNTRWFLVFLPPVIMWLGNTVGWFSHRFARQTIATALFLLLVGFPLLQGRGINEYLVSPYREVDQFIFQAKKHIAQEKNACLYFPEAHDDVERIALFYFNQNRFSSPRDCRKHFTLFLGVGEVDAIPLENLKEVIWNGKGQALYEGAYVSLPHSLPSVVF